MGSIGCGGLSIVTAPIISYLGEPGTPNKELSSVPARHVPAGFCS